MHPALTNDYSVKGGLQEQTEDRPVKTLQLTSKRKVLGIRIRAMGTDKDTGAAFLPR